MHRKTPLSESLFNEVSGFWYEILLKKRIQYRSCLLNFPTYFRTFLQKISWQLLQEEDWVLLKTVSVAIANNISKADYQKGICSLCFWDHVWVDSWIFPLKLFTKAFLVLEFSLLFELLKSSFSSSKLLLLR